MSALDDDQFGSEPVTDLREIAQARKSLFEEDGYSLPLQDAELAAGLTEADVWQFATASSAS